jgi:DNA-directed RNA polymerase specialized sigma24 family protein
MPEGGSVSRWIQALKEGDSAAAQNLWEGYFHRLVSLARAKLRGVVRRAEDEEDAALSAFDAFCRGAARGRYPQVADRDDLWRLLVVITARKASNLAGRERRLKRGGGAVRGDSALAGPAGADAGDGWERLVGDEPTPDFAAQAAEEYRRLLGRLDDDQLRAIAESKLEGCTNEEIASRLHCSRATVERRLGVIRRLWEVEGGA